MKKALALFLVLFLTVHQTAFAQYFPPSGGSGGGGTSTITVNVGGTFSGGGSALTAPQTSFVYVPYAGTITAATLTADQTGSAVVDVWKVPLGSVPATSANSIAASDLPTLSSQIQKTDTTLTGWTKTVNAGDVIYFNLNSSSTITQLAVSLSVSRTGTNAGTVTTASVVSANGFTGTVANPTTTPAFTLGTSISGVLKGSSGALAAATAGTDYQAPITLTTTGSSGAATFSGGTLNIPQYSGGGGTPGGSNGQVQFNNSGAFGGLTNTQLTADINAFTTSLSGAVPASGGGTTNFLRADGTFAVPAGSGGGTVTTTGSPVSGNLAKFSGSTSIVNGDLSGDITTSGTLVTTLASTAVTAGSYTSANVTVDAKGRITAAANGSGGSGLGPLTGDVTASGTGSQPTFSFGQSNVVTGSYSSNQNNLVLTGLGSTANVARLTATAYVDITGLVPPASPEGCRITLQNVLGGSNYPIRLVANSGSSTAANQFGFLSNLYLAPGDQISLIYDNTAAVWREYAPHKAIDDSLWGCGPDGNVSISSGTTTLARDTYYENLTISGTGNLKPNGWRVFVNGMLDLSAAPAGAITYNATASNNASGATGGTPAPVLVVNSIGTANNTVGGATGGTGNGATGTSTSTHTNNGGNSGASGAGGAGTATTGGNGVNPSANVNCPIYKAVDQLSLNVTAIGGGASGGSGGAGGGDSINSGGGGGGGSIGPGVIGIWARYINRGSNATAAIIQSKGVTGGNGGTAPTGNCGGGGGAGGSGGGWVHLVFGGLFGSTITGAIDVSSGAGGTGGNGVGTGIGGSGAHGASSGTVDLINVTTGIFTNTASSAGSAGSAGSGTTGGAGGAGVTSQVNL